jgi:hypothetical protein
MMPYENLEGDKMPGRTCMASRSSLSPCSPETSIWGPFNVCQKGLPKAVCNILLLFAMPPGYRTCGNHNILK